jgi:hypothetical protein
MSEVGRTGVTTALLTAVLTALLGLAACGGTGETAQDEPPAQEETVTQSPSQSQGQSQSPTPAPSPAPGAGTPQARQAVADLAERLGVAQDAIVVSAVEAVTWSDGSLGCAQKGRAYTQALVDGSRITLEAGGRTYAYHAAGREAPFYCARPTQ